MTSTSSPVRNAGKRQARKILVRAVVAIRPGKNQRQERSASIAGDSFRDKSAVGSRQSAVGSHEVGIQEAESKRQPVPRLPTADCLLPTSNYRRGGRGPR